MPTAVDRRDLEDRCKPVGDVPAAGAVLDRFLHHAEVIPIEGRSYHGLGHPTPMEDLDDSHDEAESPEIGGGF